ncbi:hypothetical protein quinque_002167 [Culex quinquefasciatus]
MLIVKAEPGTTEVETEAPEADESTPDPFGDIEPTGNTATETLISSLNEEGPKIVIKHNPANPGWTTCRVARQRATRVRASRRGRTHTRWVNLTVGLVDDYDGGSMELGSLDVADLPYVLREMVDLGGPIAAIAGVCTTRDPRNLFRNRINNKDTLTSNSLSNIAEINSQRHFGLVELNRRRTDLEEQEKDQATLLEAVPAAKVMFTDVPIASFKEETETREQFGLATAAAPAVTGTAVAKMIQADNFVTMQMLSSKWS